VLQLHLLCCETTTALLIPPSASKVCPKEPVLHLPRSNRRRVVGRNANEPTGNPHSCVPLRRGLVQWLAWVFQPKERKKERGFPQGPRRKNSAGWFFKKHLPWGTVLTFESSATVARGGEAWHRNVWRPVYIRPSLQLSLTLACIKALSKTLPNIHGASHVPAPPLAWAPADVVDRNLVRLGFPYYVELIDPTFRDAGGVD